MSFKVKTPTSWVSRDALKVGDELASIDGQPNVVTGILPRGIGKEFRITFSDGRAMEASGDHLWRVRFIHEYAKGCGSGIHNGWHVFTTDAIRTFCLNGSRRNEHRKVYLPLVTGDFGSNEVLPIDPWLLGILIGDGGLTTTTPVLTSADQEIVDRVACSIAPYGLHLEPVVSNGVHRYGYWLSGGQHGPSHKNLLTVTLRELELMGLDSPRKFVPASYLNGDKECRWQLLRGLLDADGTRGWSDEISFSSTSHELAKGVQQLVRSLGGLSTIYGPKRKWCSYKGERRLGKPAFYVSVRLREREQAFFLERKKAAARQNQPRLTIETIEYVGEKETQSITVSHPSGLFVTDEYVVTHC